MNGNQVRADFATLDQLAADQGTHAGSVEGYRETLRQHALQAIGNFGGGIGTEEHDACMRRVDELIDEHINTTRTFQTSTGVVHDDFLQAGQMARRTFASGA
jgi:hypothetical protein